jgi:hypothetical protein
MFCPAASQQKSTLLFTSFCELSHQRPQSSSASRFTAGAFGRQLSPANQLALLFVFGPVDLASGKAVIENVNRRGAASISMMRLDIASPNSRSSVARPSIYRLCSTLRQLGDIAGDPPRFILAAGRRLEIIFADAFAKAAAELRCSALVHWN